MSPVKVIISIDSNSLKKIDHHVKNNVFKNRNQAIQIAVNESLGRLEHKRLENECSKLDTHIEQQMADEGIANA